MNFLERLKEDMIDIRNSAGMRRKVAVDAEALFRLIEDYERIDAYIREADGQERRGLYTPEKAVEIAALNLYHHNGRNPFKVVKQVVGVLHQTYSTHERLDAMAAKHGEETCHDKNNQ